MMDHFKFKFQGEQKEQIGVARKDPIEAKALLSKSGQLFQYF
jgi:hypothetical protein